MSSDQWSDSACGTNVTPLPPESEALERQSIGSYLRRQRELRGISVEELANLTRIPLRSLQRLESGSFDNDVDGFVRGFVRTVAAGLGLDPDDTISRMLSEPRADRAPAIDRLPRPPRVLVGVVLVVLLAAAVGLVRIVAPTDQAAGVTSTESETIYRRDPVRALAESELASGSAAVAVPGVSAPPPLPPR